VILVFGEEWLQVTEKNQPTVENMMFKRYASRPHISGNLEFRNPNLD